MMAETRCPYCGASEDANGPRLTFECGSGGSCESSVIRAAPCYLRQLASANAKIAKLKQENRDADLLLGDTWRDVISIMHGNGGSVESALRQQLHNLSANLRIANAKIAELEQAATTLQQLEELLEKNGTVTISRMWANVGIRVNTKNTTGDAKDLPAAIAAAYAAKEE